MENNETEPYIDTDIIIRLLTSDDIRKQKASAALFDKVYNGKLILLAPTTVIADAVFVLSSPRLYNIPRKEIRDMLSSLIKIPNFKVENKQIVLDALDLYTSYNLDFGDSLLAACVGQTKRKAIYSYDHDFDRIEGIERKEP